MELYKEILIHALQGSQIEVSISNPNFDLQEIVIQECYQALQKIKAIIEDDSLEDSECFQRIEEIVRLFESLGSSGGRRHDFG